MMFLFRSAFVIATVVSTLFCTAVAMPQYPGPYGVADAVTTNGPVTYTYANGAIQTVSDTSTSSTAAASSVASSPPAATPTKTSGGRSLHNPGGTVALGAAAVFVYFAL